jgi:hypothetical protein
MSAPEFPTDWKLKRMLQEAEIRASAQLGLIVAQVRNEIAQHAAGTLAELTTNKAFAKRQDWYPDVLGKVLREHLTEDEIAYRRSVTSKTSGKKGFLSVQRQPSTLEAKFIDGLGERGLYAPTEQTGRTGQLFHPGLNGNRPFYTLPNGRLKRMVIELYGELYHHPASEYCPLEEDSDAQWMEDQYRQIGVDAKVIWGKQIGTRKRMRETLDMITAWLGRRRFLSHE